MRMALRDATTQHRSVALTRHVERTLNIENVIFQLKLWVHIAFYSRLIIYKTERIWNFVPLANEVNIFTKRKMQSRQIYKWFSLLCVCAYGYFSIKHYNITNLTSLFMWLYFFLYLWHVTIENCIKWRNNEFKIYCICITSLLYQWDYKIIHETK